MTGSVIRRIIGAMSAAMLLVSVIVTAFAWPASQSAPRDVPLGIAGPPPFVERVEARLDAAAPGAFEVTAFADAAEARRAIENREVYGAVVVGEPPAVLTAPAASPAVAQLLDGVAATLRGTPAPHGEAVVPLPAGDPRGVGFSAAALPLVIGGLALGVLSFVLVAGVLGRLIAAAGGAVAGGLAAAAILGPWLGILPGGYLVTSSAIALVLLAGGAVVVGCATLLGPRGIGLAALLLMIIGNPLSGAAGAPELLPSGWGALGQWLPPGAGATLLRSVSYFEGAGSTDPVWVLATWIVLGVAAAVVGLGADQRRAGTTPSRKRRNSA